MIVGMILGTGQSAWLCLVRGLRYLGRNVLERPVPDHTEHDVDILVTEQGLADLRGLAPRERAVEVIKHCVHPDYRNAMLDYYERACVRGGHTPHILEEAFSWHTRLEQQGTMKQS